MRFTESKDKFEIELTNQDSHVERVWLSAKIAELKAQAQINFIALNPDFPDGEKWEPQE